jgi:hypothetical protein
MLLKVGAGFPIRIIRKNSVTFPESLLAAKRVLHGLFCVKIGRKQKRFIHSEIGFLKKIKINKGFVA